VIDEKSMISNRGKGGSGRFSCRGWISLKLKTGKKAEMRFEEVLKVLPSDGPVRTFLKRCQQYITNPPPENWDGVFNL
jgi:hypothetical protein